MPYDTEQGGKVAADTLVKTCFYNLVSSPSKNGTNLKAPGRNLGICFPQTIQQAALQGSNSKSTLKLKRTQASKKERYGHIMTILTDITVGNALSYGRKLQRNTNQSGRNQKKLPGGRTIRISPDDH